MNGRTLFALPLLLAAVPAMAQDEPTTRTRVALGPQLVPTYPGADKVSLRPLVDVSRADGDEDFAFEAPDESFGIALVQTDAVAFGPSLGFQGKRRARDVGAALPEVGFTVEVGGFAELQVAPAFRLRGEVRKGLGGHRGWIGTIGADYVARDRDLWLVSIGPRVTLSDTRYHRAYFGVSPASATATGVPAFDARGGVQAVGAVLGAIRQLSPRWGLYGYAKYDRLVRDAADSPVTRRFGSRNQLSGGLALTYTFDGGF